MAISSLRSVLRKGHGRPPFPECRHCGRLPPAPYSKTSRGQRGPLASHTASRAGKSPRPREPWRAVRQVSLNPGCGLAPGPLHARWPFAPGVVSGAPAPPSVRARDTGGAGHHEPTPTGRQDVTGLDVQGLRQGCLEPRAGDLRRGAQPRRGAPPRGAARCPRVGRDGRRHPGGRGAPAAWTAGEARPRARGEAGHARRRLLRHRQPLGDGGRRAAEDGLLQRAQPRRRHRALAPPRAAHLRRRGGVPASRREAQLGRRAARVRHRGALRAGARLGGAPLVYMDHAASTHAPASVLSAYTEFVAREYANIHRGTHHLSRKATERFEECYYIVADYLDAELRRGARRASPTTPRRRSTCAAT